MGMEYMIDLKDGAKRELAECLAECLANAVNLSFKAQGHHWNVKGMLFSQFHDFFGMIYEDVHGMIDHTAENMLKLGFDAPYRIVEFARLTSMEDMDCGCDAKAMLYDLLAANTVMIKCVNDCFKAADAADEQGIADFMASRDDMHKKWDWQLRAYLHNIEAL
jgi:starvation-inducible DNA-binding protein